MSNTLDPIQPKDVIEKMALFSLVKDPKNWKLPTTPMRFHLKNREQAEKLKEAIVFFVGGAETYEDGTGYIVVQSRGYYHYISA